MYGPHVGLIILEIVEVCKYWAEQNTKEIKENSMEIGPFFIS